MSLPLMKLKWFPQSKTFHVRTTLDAFRKAKQQDFDAIFLTDTLVGMSVYQLMTALREINNHRRTPIFLLSLQPERHPTAPEPLLENVFVFHYENEMDAAVDRLNDWLFMGEQLQDQQLHPPIRTDLSLVDDLVAATKKSLQKLAGGVGLRSMPVESFNKSTRYIDSVELAGVTFFETPATAFFFLLAFPEKTLMGLLSRISNLESAPSLEPAKSVSEKGMMSVFGAVMGALSQFLRMREGRTQESYYLGDKEAIRRFHGPTSYIVPFESDDGRFFVIVSFKSNNRS